MAVLFMIALAVLLTIALSILVSGGMSTNVWCFCTLQCSEQLKLVHCIKTVCSSAVGSPLCSGTSIMRMLLCIKVVHKIIAHSS
jgi:hypothetical protein